MNAQMLPDVSFSPGSIGFIIDELIKAKRAANRRAVYVHALRYTLFLFAAGIEDMPAELLSVMDVDRFLSRWSAPATRKTMMLRLSVFFSYARKRSFIPSNPMEEIFPITLDLKPPRIFTPDEADAFIAATRREAIKLLPGYVLGLYTGIRQAELAKLDWSAVDLDRKIVTVDAAASKVRRRRIVPIHDKAVKLLAGLRGIKIGHYSSAQRMNRIRIERAMGWRSIPKNILRHSAASYLVALHGDIGRVARILGNSPDVLLNRYVELVSPSDAERFWSIKP